jgi:hypothetical protein
MPVIGVLGIGSPESNAKQLASFRNGLSEQGFAEGQNAVIESRFAATGQYDGLLSLAFDLVRLPVTVLAAIGTAGVARSSFRYIPPNSGQAAPPRLARCRTIHRAGDLACTAIRSLGIETRCRGLSTLTALATVMHSCARRT